MQHQNSTKKPNSILIGITLVVCICLLISLEWILSRTEPAVIPLAEAKETPFFAPVPTAVPTAVPKPLTESQDPSDPYPDLYGDNPDPCYMPAEDKVIYLTFDDGPSSVTAELLKVLKQEGVFATFFVMGDSPQKQELLRQLVFDGHTVGVHTYTHDYSYLYWNKASYLADFCRQYYAVWAATGYRPRIFRFPGGSVNSYNRHLYRDLISEMQNRGFVYYDWNVTSEDAIGVTDPKEQLNHLLTQSQNKNRIIALLHDSPQNPEIWWTVQEYIRTMKEAGYTFKALDSSVKPMHFPY